MGHRSTTGGKKGGWRGGRKLKQQKSHKNKYDRFSRTDPIRRCGKCEHYHGNTFNGICSYEQTQTSSYLEVTPQTLCIYNLRPIKISGLEKASESD